MRGCPARRTGVGTPRCGVRVCLISRTADGPAVRPYLSNQHIPHHVRMVPVVGLSIERDQDHGSVSGVFDGVRQPRRKVKAKCLALGYWDVLDFILKPDPDQTGAEDNGDFGAAAVEMVAAHAAGFGEDQM